METTNMGIETRADRDASHNEKGGPPRRSLLLAAAAVLGLAATPARADHITFAVIGPHEYDLPVDLVSEANLQTANINLGYTEIKAPISGLIGRTSVTKGNVVGPDSGILTSIVSQDPMYVTIPVSQREFLQLKGDQRQTGGAALTVNLRFSDGSAYELPGKINFVDVSVDRATDSVLVRASVPNPQGRLIDGQLVKVTIAGEKPQEKVLVPQSALIADQQGVYVFIVEDGKAAVRRLKLGGESGPNAIVESGLEGGEQVIVEGVEALRPGSPVIASPAAKTPGRS